MTLPFRTVRPTMGSDRNTRTGRCAAPWTSDQTAPLNGALNGPIHDARQLTGPDQTGYIMLDGKLYTLRITRAGKLILTK